MKKISKILWGTALIAVGVIFALNAFGITDIELFFDGWWTLFIIVPCCVGIFSEREKTGNIIGLCIGVFLLLCCQNVLGFDILWKLAVPAIIVILGLCGTRNDQRGITDRDRLADDSGGNLRADRQPSGAGRKQRIKNRKKTQKNT